MRKDIKTVFFAGAVAVLTLGGTMVSFAGTWKTGDGADQNRWWYDFENGSYAANGWQWIDGNNDGVAECYYFDPSGWMLTGTSTPDGYTVNADGAPSLLPESFRITLQLGEPEVERFLQSVQPDFQAEQVGGLYLNIRYEEHVLRCVTGVSLNVFTLDKRIEQGWDEEVKRFLRERQIAYVEE